MSTVKATYLQHPSATSENVTLNADGSVDATVNGYAQSSELAGYVSKSSVSGNMFSVVGERGSAPTSGQFYAFGNGAADHQAAVPYACKMIAVAAVGGPAHTGTTSLQIVKNGVAMGSDYSFSYAGTTGSATEFAIPLAFAAGDVFNATVISAGSGDGGNVTFVFRID